MNFLITAEFYSFFATAVCQRFNFIQFVPVIAYVTTAVNSFPHQPLTVYNVPQKPQNVFFFYAEGLPVVEFQLYTFTEH